MWYQGKKEVFSWRKTVGSSLDYPRRKHANYGRSLVLNFLDIFSGMTRVQTMWCFSIKAAET